jgi:hypothetical protein
MNVFPWAWIMTFWRLLLALVFFGTAFPAFPKTAAPQVDVRVVGPLNRVFLSTSITDEPMPMVELWAARNEYEPAQLAFHSDTTVTVDGVYATDLVNSKGGSILASSFSYRFPGYVPVNRHTPRTPPDEVEGNTPGWYPDPLQDVKELQFKGNGAMWVSWRVPAGTPAGDYRGELAFRIDAMERRIPVLLHVWGFTLPDQPSMYSSNWLHVSQVESRYRVRRGSEAFWKVIDAIAADMAAHRQNVIFTPLNLIHSTEQADGSYVFDFRDYDRWVALFLRHGFAAFEGSHLFHGRNSYSIRRGGINGRQEEFGETQLATDSGQQYLGQLLRALDRENARLGIRDKYVQHVADEAKPGQLPLYRDIAAIVHSAMPATAIIDATELPSSQVEGLMDVPVPLMGRPLFPVKAGIGEKWGRWWYTAVVPNGRFPNRFIDYPLVKMRIIPWLNWRYDVQGYMHYAYNWWFTPSGVSPWRDVEQSGKYPSGDGFVVYPPEREGSIAPVSSLRWEAFRDGMEDYEYLRLLDQARLALAAAGQDGKWQDLKSQVDGVYRDLRMAVRGTEDYPRDPELLLNLRKRIGYVLDACAQQKLINGEAKAGA